MSYVNTIQTQSNTYTYDQLQAMMANGTIDSSTVQNVSVFNQSADPSACTDGKDDGKLGFFESIGSAISGAVKGVVNGVKGMFFDENGNFSLGNTLKTIATGAACLIPGVGPVIAAGLCTVGVVKGVSGVAQGISAAASATTDAEAKAAFESIGSGVLTTGLSAVGVKASVGAIAKNVANTGVVASAADDVAKMSFSKQVGTIKDGVVNSFKNGNGIIGGAKSAANTLTGNYYGAAWNSATGTTLQKAGTVMKQTAHDTGANMVKAATTAKNKAQEKIDKLTGKQGSNSSIESMNKKFSKEYGDIADGDGTYTSKDGSKTLEVKKVTNADGKTSYEFSTKKNTGTKTEYAKTTESTTSKTEVAKDELSNYKLSEEQTNSLMDGNEVTASDGTKLTYDKGTGKISATKTTESTAYSKDVTTTNTLDKVKKQQVEIKAADGTTTKVKLGDKLKNAGDTVTTADGTTYTLNKNNTVTSTKTGNASKLAYDYQNFKDAAIAGNYIGLPSSGNVFRTGITIASGNAADTTEDIPMATVNTQTGREYYLEDYSIMSEDEVNQAYSDIMAQSQEIQL